MLCWITFFTFFCLTIYKYFLLNETAVSLHIKCFLVYYYWHVSTVIPAYKSLYLEYPADIKYGQHTCVQAYAG